MKTPTGNSEPPSPLDAVRQARHPLELLAALTSFPGACTQATVEVLAGEAGATTNVDIAQLRTDQACELNAILASVEQAAHVTTLPQLVQLASKQPLAFGSAFWDLLRCLADDAAKKGDAERAEALRTCMGVRESVRTTVTRLNSFLSDAERGDIEPAFCEPAFLDWLRLYQRALRADPEDAASVSAIREYLILRSRRAKALQNREPDGPGRIRIRLEGLEEAWHLLSFHLNEPFAKLAHRLSDPALSVDQCIQEAQQLAQAATVSPRFRW